MVGWEETGRELAPVSAVALLVTCEADELREVGNDIG